MINYLLYHILLKNGNMANFAVDRARECGINFQNSLLYTEAPSDDSLPVTFDILSELLDKVNGKKFTISRNGGYYISSCPANFVTHHISNLTYNIDFTKIKWEGMLNKRSLSYLKSDEMSLHIRRWDDEIDFCGHFIAEIKIDEALEKVKNLRYLDYSYSSYFRVYLIDKEYLEDVPFSSLEGSLTKGAR